MVNPNKAWAEYIEALDTVRAHPMCGKLEDVGGAFLVTYPAGDFSVDGVRVNYAEGKKKALEKALVIMERHWVESYPQAGRPE